jgi:2-iminoacetate synthase ThiH
VTTVPERVTETETSTCGFCEEPFTLNPNDNRYTATKEESEATLAELEKMRHGELRHVWAGHMATALAYEIAQGIKPDWATRKARRK